MAQRSGAKLTLVRPFRDAALQSVGHTIAAAPTSHSRADAILRSAYQSVRATDRALLRSGRPLSRRNYYKRAQTN